ncbi:MAG TPA: YCF48-related protein, partial [Anaerolineae bacterium]|nr:YCF48-related protein [Anaerolineae bacterium]
MKTISKRISIALLGLAVLTSLATSAVVARPASSPQMEPAVPAQGGASPWKLQWHGKGDFTDVQFVDPNHLWAVGTEGLLLHSVDGGTYWQMQDARTSEDLQAIHSIDDDRAWAVGGGGVILHTENGGHTWVMQDSGTTAALHDLCLQEAGSGWAVGAGGTILHTGDGGLNWQGQASGSNRDLLALHCEDAETAWAVGEGGTILHTADGGQGWQPQNSTTAGPLRGISFGDESNGWAVGGIGQILHTSNGGTTWAAQTSPAARELNGVFATSATQVWAAGNAGTILHSSNGGGNWATHDSGTPENLTAIAAGDGSTVMAVGHVRQMRFSGDAGSTWELRGGGGLRTLHGLDFIDDQYGWVVGWSQEENEDQSGALAQGTAQDPWYDPYRGAMLRTMDGGQTWAGVQIPAEGWIMDVDFVDEHYGWTNGKYGHIWHTIDGGDTWDLQYALPEGNYSYRVQFFDRQEGWASERDWDLHHTTDGGDTWRHVSAPAASPPGGMYWDADRLHGWIAYDKQAVCRTTDGGENWDRQDLGGYLRDVHFLPGSPLGWLVGANASDQGLIYHSSDYGESWQVQQDGTDPWTDNALRGVVFIDADTGWTVGYQGTILHTRDGGDNWLHQPSPVEESLGSGWPAAPDPPREGRGGGGGITFVGDKGWIVGESGVILHYAGEPTTTYSFQTAGAPTIDGRLWDWVTETGLSLDPETADGALGPVLPDGAGDLSAQMRSLWDANNLYLAVTVTDDTLVADSDLLANDDALVLGIDGNFDLTPGGSDDHEYAIGWDGRVTDFGVPTTAIQAAASVSDGGYTVEVAIPFSELDTVPLQHARTIGLALALRDDDDGGPFDSLLVRDGQDTASSSAEYGHLQLLGNTLTFRQSANDYSSVDDTFIS